MKVKFQTDYRDFAEAVWLASAKSSSKNNVLNFILLYAIVAVLGSLPVLMFAPHFVFAVIDFAVIFLICFYFFRPPARSYYYKYYQSIYGIYSFDFEISLEEETVNYGDEFSKSFVSWNRVKELIELQDNIYLIFKSNIGLKIPKTAFYNSPQIGEFVSFAKSRIPVNDKQLND